MTSCWGDWWGYSGTEWNAGDTRGQTAVFRLQSWYPIGSGQ